MLIKHGKTNIKYLFIVIVLATIVGGGVWYCQYISVECKTSADCEGKTHIMCVGEWKCVNNQCSWNCEVEEKQELKETKLEDETTSWKTYRNKEYGFKIRYPEDWLIEDHLTATSCCLNIFNSVDPYPEGFFLGPNVMKVQFQYHVDESISSKQDYIDNVIKESEGPPNLEFPKGTINRDWISSFVNENGVDILEFSEGKPADSYYVIAINNDFSETLHVLVWNPDIKFNQILSTFRFIEREMIPREIISQIDKDPDFIDWLEDIRSSNPSTDINDFFRADSEWTKKIYNWAEFTIGEEEEVRLGCVTGDKEIYSPDKNKYIYFPCNFGAVDTDIWLYNRNGDKKMERIGSMGPSGGFDDSFWIDEDHFIVLSYSMVTSEDCSASIGYWDLISQETVLYTAKELNCWK